MNHEKSAELKRIARGKMIGNYGTAIGAYLIQTLISLVISLIVSSTVDTYTVSGMLIYIAVVIIVNLIMITLAVGELTIYLNIACGNKAKSSDVFKGVSLHPDKSIILGILVGIRIFIWVVPSIVALVIYYCTESIGAILAFGVLGIVGTIKAVYVECELSQCFYILLDFPDYSITEIMDVSKQMMKGHVGEYFYITCSFIPLSLLGLLSIGIGMLFIYPYIKMTMTEYYLDLIKRKNNPVGSNFDEVISERLDGHVGIGEEISRSE